MGENTLVIPVLIPGRIIELKLYAENSARDTLSEVADAMEHGEAQYQIKEGCYYEYTLTDGYKLQPSEYISQSKVHPSSGRISPNIYVGTLCMDVLDRDNQACGEVKLEVRSTKITYRSDYRHMLEEITEKCTELLLQHSSPVSQYFEPDSSADASTLYQRFAFMKSVLDSVEFSDSVHKIISAPVTRWKESEVIKDIRSVKRFTNSAIRQIASAGNRTDLPENHPLSGYFTSIPTRITTLNKSETVDTPENRFVKHALMYFQSICSDFRSRIAAGSRLQKEADVLIEKLEHFLSHSVFKEISLPTTLPLNSPVLQRKEGYREVLRVWLMIDLAAKMIWHGGQDVYSGNKRDVAVLYEYWLFFKLLDILKEVFRIDSLATESLIESTKDGLGLKLRQGKFLPVEGIYNSDSRKLRIEFSYNKTFSGNKAYPHGGSWTRDLRPDYTLSIWPFGIEQEQAEKEELIVHIHFDAKYRVDNLQSILGSNDNLDEEKEDQKKGNFKRADILKMHTYRDAIRRTAGAYVLYPGSLSDRKHGFHELLPGLGAFAISPSKSNNGTEELKRFLYEVVAHFMNRASQRERISFRSYEVYKDAAPDTMTAALPETHGSNRGLLPDETYVLVGYYKKENLDWILRTGLYNARADSARGSLRLGPGEAGAKYLLLHTTGETSTGRLLKITETGPRIFSKQTLIDKKYPAAPSQDYYLVYKVEEVQDIEFADTRWDITQLSAYKGRRGSALPFAVTLKELMQVIVS